MMSEAQLREVMESTFPPLFRQIARRIGEDEAQDILQETYYRAWRKLDLDAYPDPMPWLAICAHRLVDTRLARRRRRQEVSLEAFLAAGAEPVARPETRDLASLWDAVAKLTPMRQIVFYLREILGLDDQAIADRCGITTATVRRHASMAAHALAIALLIR